MIDIFRSDIDGDYYINGKKLEHCFFCGSVLFPDGIDANSEDIHVWVSRFNCYLHKKGEIGKAKLCGNCVNEIKDIVS